MKSRATKTAGSTPIKRQEGAFGRNLIGSMLEALAYAKGENVPVRVTTVMVPAVDVKGIRTRQHLSQAQFAAKFGFTPSSVRNWEQGRRVPDGPARILLAVIAEHPEVVEGVLLRTA